MQTGSWRVSYTPGSWVLLGGTHCMLVVQPAGEPYSRLIGELWEPVLRASEIDDVAEPLARFDLAQLPSLGVFCWTDGHLRAMLRGGVAVRDADTGELLFRGAGVQTWSEVAVQPARVRVELEPVTDERGLVLPIVVGVVQISTLLLDTTQVETTEPEPTPATEATEATEELAIEDIPVAPAEPQGGPPDACAPAVQPSIEHDVELFRAEPAIPIDAAGAEQPRAAPPALAMLRSAGQDPVPVDRDVVVGRGPRAAAETGQDPRLLTVRSPSHDISRNHVRVSIHRGQLTVTDLHSTNGTTLIRRDAALGSERLPAGEAVALELGDVLDLGDGVTVAVDAPAEGDGRD